MNMKIRLFLMMEEFSSNHGYMLHVALNDFNKMKRDRTKELKGLSCFKDDSKGISAIIESEFDTSNLVFSHKEACTARALYLDYQPVYGGYVIQQYVNDGGGITHPFGRTRIKGKEMYNALYFHFAVTVEMKNKRVYYE